MISKHKQKKREVSIQRATKNLMLYLRRDSKICQEQEKEENRNRNLIFPENVDF